VTTIIFVLAATLIGSFMIKLKEREEPQQNHSS